MAKTSSRNRTVISNSKAHDSAGKLIFSNARLCSQFLRDYSDIDLLKNVTEEDIEDVTTRYIPMFTEERDSDVVKRVRLRNNECMYIIALIEHKSTVDYNVSMQVLRYMVYIWEDYEKEREAEHKGITHTKDFKYPPILPIVYYEGRGSWTAAKDFRDRVFLNDVFKEFIPDYRYKLIRLRNYTLIIPRDQSMRRTVFGTADRCSDHAVRHGKISDAYLHHQSRPRCCYVQIVQRWILHRARLRGV